MIFTFIILAVWLALMLFALWKTFRTEDLEAARYWNMMGMLYIIAALVTINSMYNQTG